MQPERIRSRPLWSALPPATVRRLCGARRLVEPSFSAMLRAASAVVYSTGAFDRTAAPPSSRLTRLQRRSRPRATTGADGRGGLVGAHWRQWHRPYAGKCDARLDQRIGQRYFIKRGGMTRIGLEPNGESVLFYGIADACHVPSAPGSGDAARCFAHVQAVPLVPLPEFSCCTCDVAPVKYPQSANASRK